MRRFIAVAALLFASVIQVSEAQAFPCRAYAYYGPSFAHVSVTNPYGVPIACVAGIQAVRNDGLPVWGQFNLGFIPYGMTEFGYVYTQGPYFFTAAYGWADCWFLY